MTEPISPCDDQARLSRLAPGFGDPVADAQACFRVVLDAVAHPGRVLHLSIDLVAPTPLGGAAAAIGLTLCDLETPIWLDRSLEPIAQYLRFHCGAEIVTSPEQSRFAFAGAAAELPPLDQFALGSDEYPDRSTTLVLEVANLRAGDGLRLAGPGIAGETGLEVAGVPAHFWRQRRELGFLLPRGLDLIFTCGSSLAALPRSTRVLD